MSTSRSVNLVSGGAGQKPVPSDDYILRACKGKKRYIDTTTARHACKDHRAKFGEEKQAYKCEGCGYIHIGSITTFEEREWKRIEEKRRKEEDNGAK